MILSGHLCSILAHSAIHKKSFTVISMRFLSQKCLKKRMDITVKLAEYKSDCLVEKLTS